MASVVQNLIEKTLGDGARSTKFECYINFNSELFPSAEDVLMLVKTSNFPGKTHTVIDLKYRGINIPIKGQTIYDNTWACTFYLTQDHALKKAFEDWIESLDQVNNIKEVSDTVKKAQSYNSRNGYVIDMQIAQMDFHGSQQTVIYELKNVFPKSIAGMEVDYTNVGSVLEFTVEFAYSHFDTKVLKSAEGTFVDDIKNKAQTRVSEVVGTTRQQVSSIFKSARSSFNRNPVLGSDNSVFSPSEMGSRLE